MVDLRLYLKCMSIGDNKTSFPPELAWKINKGQ